MEAGNFIFALGLALFAGLATGIGGLFVLLFRKTNEKFLSLALGFSAGVMIYISFVELLANAKFYLEKSMSVKASGWIIFIAFFGGMLFIALIDKLVPERENPHEMRRIEEADSNLVAKNSSKLMKTGMLTALAITIHNFPEGLVTFASAVTQPKLGIAIAIAVAIHNIPEGISVAVPVQFATGDRKKAFYMSLLSGLAEPIGAIIAFIFLAPYINDTILGVIFATIAGIMVFISFDELLPAAREYGEHHLSIMGLITGMMVMGISLLIVF